MERRTYDAVQMGAQLQTCAACGRAFFMTHPALRCVLCRRAARPTAAVAVSCVWRCGRCQATGTCEVRPRPGETRAATATRQQATTRGQCVAGCLLELTPTAAGRG